MLEPQTPSTGTLNMWTSFRTYFIQLRASFSEVLSVLTRTSEFYMDKTPPVMHGPFRRYV